MKKVWCTVALAAIATVSNYSLAQDEVISDIGSDEEVVNEEVITHEVKKSEPRLEVSLWGLGGVSTFMYTPAVGSKSMGFGGGGGIGVGYFFNDNFGVRLGLELMTYSSTFKADSTAFKYVLTDKDGDTVKFNAKFRSYEEQQTAMLLNIPIVAAFEYNRFYAQLGVKVGLGLTHKFNTTANSMVTWGEYPAMNVTYPNPNINTNDDFRPYGFSNYDNIKANGTFDLGLNLALTAEVGAKWQLNDRFNLYTGIYADYGFLNVASKKDKPMVDYLSYDAPLEKYTTFNSILNSSQNPLNKQENFTDRVSMLSAGIKVSLGINTSPRKKFNANDDAYQADGYTPVYTYEEDDEQVTETTEHVQGEKQDERQVHVEPVQRQRPTALASQSQIENDIAELKRMQEILKLQIEANARNQEVILEAVKAAQDAATAAAEAARTAQNAVLLQQNRETTNVERGSAAERKTTTTKTTKARKEISGLVFRVQISARHNRLDDMNEQFASYRLGMKIIEEFHDNIYKYMVGSFKQVEAASAACNEVRKKGITDAFVVAYYRGNRISITEAYSILGRN